MIPDSFKHIINDVYRLEKGLSPDNLNEELRNIAINSPRKQSRICLHNHDDAIVQIMYICHLKGCKVKIHKHILFPEWILFLNAHVNIKYFNKFGKETSKLTIDTSKSNGTKIHYIPHNIFHTIEFLEDSFFLEVKQGPFERSSTKYLSTN